LAIIGQYTLVNEGRSCKMLKHNLQVAGVSLSGDTPKIYVHKILRNSIRYFNLLNKFVIIREDRCITIYVFQNTATCQILMVLYQDT
jgi:hypothetical protein